MIVVDASAALAGILHDDAARASLADGELHVPHLIDAELMSGLRRLLLAGAVDGSTATLLLTAWRRVALRRHPLIGLLPRMWELRDNVSAYDASYVALAEALAIPLVTADARLARAPGIRCSVTVVPR